MPPAAPADRRHSAGLSLNTLTGCIQSRSESLDSGRLVDVIVSMTEASGPTSGSVGEASGPAAGYYYQVRYALLRSLERLKKTPTASVSVEKLDDVAVEYDGGVIDREQLKHSLQPGKTYSDTSPALWRTLGNWIASSGESEIDEAGGRLFLTTNGSTSEGSALSLLGPGRSKEDVAEALTLLRAVALSSKSETTAKDRASFLALAAPLQGALLSAVTVVSQAPELSALDGELEDAIHYACDAEFLTDFRLELEGWWFDRVMQNWTLGSGATVPLLEVQARVSLLRERYKISSLSIDVGDVPAAEPLDDRLFVKQVRALKVGTQRLQNVQKDYLRAGAQRSKWLRQLKLDPAELDTFDATLIDRWSTQSAILIDELATGAEDDEKCKVGRTLLGWAETQEVPIRNAKAQFLTSGSYHALADSLKVGWHPDYKSLFPA